MFKRLAIKHISNPTKTLRIDKPLADVDKAITFIPALSSKYKFANADPELHVFTLSGAELSSAGAFIDIFCSSFQQNKTDVTLEVRRQQRPFGRNSDILLANQHLDTVFNLLSDSMALKPGERAQLLSHQTNRETAGAHYPIYADTGAEQHASFFLKKVMLWVAAFLLLGAVLYGLYLYFRY